MSAFTDSPHAGEALPGEAWTPRTAVRAAAAMSALLLALVAVAGAGALRLLGGHGPGSTAEAQVGVGPSQLARVEIPAGYMRLYVGAAARYGIDWSILAGVGRVECDHGRDPDPACTVPGAVNAAGAGGPMQFLASTWARYGVDANGDGTASRWDAADAIFSAARYLRALGAPGDYGRALLGYNHATWYVDEVERWAARYRSAGSVSTSSDPQSIAAGTPTQVLYVAGARAVLSPADGHLALVPLSVPAGVQAMVIAGNELQELPYGPGGHPDPLGAASEDCSSTVTYVLYRAGIRALGEIVRTNPLAQDYTRWGAPGPGRWVTVYATEHPTDHVFIVIAGLRLDTSHDGTDVGPNRLQDGPRWRIFDRIPGWAHWSVRHPPGL